MLLGIDLGTTYSVGAFINKKGEAEAVVNSEGSRTTPSVVYFSETGEVIVGQTAKDFLETSPGRVVMTVKNSMGKLSENGELQKIHTEAGDYLPEAISAYILRKVVCDAQAYTNETDGEVNAVITIPAYFSDSQRKATEDAARIAGINLVALVNEPTAAAYYYANKTEMTNGNILVYDLGGGTFDVTIIKIEDSNVSVLATGGLSKVGGSYFDKELADYVCSLISEKNGIDYRSPEYGDVYAELLLKAENVKKTLSLSAFSPFVVKTDKVKESFRITREKLEEIVAPLYKRSEAVVRKALKEAKLDISQLDKVIIAGGSGRIPCIEEGLKKLLNTEPSREVNPDEVVALGAVLFGERQLKNAAVGKGNEKGSKNKMITDVCSHGIGLKAFREGTREAYNHILIKRNSKLPAEGSYNFMTNRDNQDEIYLVITEGDFEELTDVTIISDACVPLPKGLRKNTRFSVTLKLDEGSLIHAYIVLTEQGNKEIEVNFVRKSNMTEAQIGEWRKRLIYTSAGAGQDNSKDGEDSDAANRQDSSKKGFLKGILGDKKKDEPEKSADDDDGEEKSGIFASLSEKHRAAEKEREKGNRMKAYQIPSIVEDAMENVIGMQPLREKLRDFYNIETNKRKRAGAVRVDISSKNFAILGPHTSGKTEAALAVARLLCKMGISKTPIPVTAVYDDIVGKDETETAQKIQTIFQSAIDNGALFIDDVEAFFDTGTGGPALMAIDLMVKAYRETKAGFSFIIAGDSKSVKQLFDAKARFEDLFRSYTVEIGAYSPKEIVDLVHVIAKQEGYVVDEDADPLIEKKAKSESATSDFEPIVFVENLIHEAEADSSNKLSTKRLVTDRDRYLLKAENFKIETGKSLEELLAEIDGLTGLKSVKETIHNLVKNVEYEKKVKKTGANTASGFGTLHLVFEGNAGTGKTTVARTLGEIYRELGVLPKGHFVECSKSDLVSQFVGDTPIKTRAMVDKAMGGILFIDEAYAICKDDNDTFGKECIETLLKALEDCRDNLMVIMAGYGPEMEKFLEKNQGLKSRLSHTVTFEDYSVDEMVSIFEHNLKKAGYKLEKGLEKEVKQLLEKKSRQKDFGNARGVRNVFDDVINAHRARLVSQKRISPDEASTITIEDLGVKEKSSNESVEQLLTELNELTGLASVKKRVNEIVNIVSMNAEREKMGLPPLPGVTLHMVFKGNPGTGKTTVARLIGKIFKGLGVLSRGHVVECGRSDLVAGYVGQTAGKTQDKVNQALGGVLFIDEAYTLSDNEGGSNSFGKEAINELVAAVENNRSDLCVIVAGYSGPMDEFIAQNEGLRSRFHNEIVFEDYSPDELMTIFENNMKKQGYTVKQEATDKVRGLIERQYGRKDFANARGVRNICDDIAAHMAVRIGALSKQGVQMTKEILTTVEKEDVYG